jgi:magnesium-transporting ATPase (P-type)
VVRSLPNAITQKKGKSALTLFLLQFHQPLVYILLAATVVTGLLREWIDAGVILAVVLVNAIIGFVQESKAVKAIEALSQSLTTSATVMRGGERRQIPATELVPGDIVLLQSGDKVPADLRLITTRELQIDESTLTGESVPVQKQSGQQPRDTLLADRLNMAYSSTLVTYGIATGVAVATGNSTEIGRINELIASADILATPLTKKIARFSGLLLYVILGLAAITFAVGIVRGESWLNMFMAVVALALGAIPDEPDACHRAAAEMAEKGLRVLAFARIERENSTTELGHNDVAKGMTFLGLQGMIDPPRPEAVAAVRVCQGAGIQVKMITGDHVITATAIARQIGLVGGSDGTDQLLALNGRDIEALSIVAMGITGTEVAKEAGDLPDRPYGIWNFNMVHNPDIKMKTGQENPINCP